MAKRAYRTRFLGKFIGKLQPKGESDFIFVAIILFCLRYFCITFADMFFEYIHVYIYIYMNYFILLIFASFVLFLSNYLACHRHPIML